MLTVDELCAILLQRYEVEDVLELLDITMEELLDHFGHRIEEKMDKLNKEFEDEFAG